MTYWVPLYFFLDERVCMILPIFLYFQYTLLSNLGHGCKAGGSCYAFKKCGCQHFVNTMEHANLKKKF